MEEVVKQDCLAVICVMPPGQVIIDRASLYQGFVHFLPHVLCVNELAPFVRLQKEIRRSLKRTVQ